MKLLASLALIPSLALGSASKNQELSWLVGCWVTPDGRAQEVWVADVDGSLVGFSVTVSDNKVGFYEVLLIKRSEEGSLSYIAHPSGQSRASFAATETTDNSVVFANPTHDYPQIIRYKRDGNQLYATTSLLDGASPNAFDKVSCN